ncbi:MAG: ImmA/IrrE family metallo-endopeptidase [bacterium]
MAVYLSSDPRDYARRVLTDLEIVRPPIEVEPILEYFGLQVRGFPPDLMSRFGGSILSIGAIDSMLLRFGNDEAVILVGENLQRHRRRMSIFHEVGHADLPWHRDSSFVCDGNPWLRHQPEIERQAFSYAAEMMMPLQMVSNYVRDLPFCAENIGIISRTFDVSFEAAAIRFLKLTDRPCAMGLIVPSSEDGGACRLHWMKYVLRSKSFPTGLTGRRHIPDQDLISGFIADQSASRGRITARDLGVSQSWSAECEMKYHGPGSALMLLSIPDVRIKLSLPKGVTSESRTIRQSLVRETGSQGSLDLGPAQGPA